MSQRDMLTDITTAALQRGMSGLHMRQEAIANNIANIETPEYKAQKVSFEEDLANAIAGERSWHPGRRRIRGLIEGVQPRVDAQDGMWRRDGNNVNIESEMVEAAKTATHYKMLARLLAKKFRMLRNAIGGGAG